MRWGLLHGVAFVGAVACQSGSVFVCNGNDDCSVDNGMGICEPTGACSFPDDVCPSGQRYGARGPLSLAGECVQYGGSSSGAENESSGAGDTTSMGSADTTGAAACPADWWDCAWPHRQRIELTRTITNPFPDIPLPIFLTAGRVDHDLMQADGEDIRFTSAGGAALPYEIERWDPDSVSTIWVNVDELGGPADHIWLYYGNAVAENDEDPSSVWGTPFVGVWHLEDEPFDSSGNDNQAALIGNTEAIAGQLANGRALLSSNGSGTSASLNVEASPSLTDIFTDGGTVSAWIRPRSLGGNNFGRIANKYESEGGWLLSVGTGNRLLFGFDFDSNAEVYWETIDDAITLASWNHVAVTYDVFGFSIPRLFVNGIEQELAEAPEQPMVDIDALPSDVDVPLILGNRSENNRRMDGILDEIRIQKTIRTPLWMSVQYDAMRDELLSYGSIETLEAAP